MSQPNETTLAYWKEHREQLRQSESQRAILTNYLLVIASAVSGLIAQQKFALTTLPLAILIVAIGIYGALATAKYHERAEYHLGQARALTQVLLSDGTLTDNKPTLDRFRDSHYAKYPRLHRIRLHKLWTGLQIGIAVYGATLAVVIAIRG